MNKSNYKMRLKSIRINGNIKYKKIKQSRKQWKIYRMILMKEEGVHKQQN